MADRVTYTWAEERYSPIQYQTFGVGPFSYTTEVREGETPEQAMDRARDFVKALAKKEYLEKCASFPARVYNARKAASEASSGKNPPRP